jgi:hypothetical protein
MLHKVTYISPDERRAIGNPLGDPVSEDESNISPSAIIPPQLSPQERKEAFEQLRRYFAKVDAQRAPVSDAEEEEIISEALRSTRPNYDRAEQSPI